MSHYDHISHHDTKDDKFYYIPALFRHNDYFNGSKIIKILILDLVKNLLRSREVCSEYYGYYGSSALNVLFINNHPVSKFIVSGKILSAKWKSSEGDDYLILKIDDTSNYFSFLEEHGGIDLFFKCDRDLLLNKGLSAYNLDSLLGLNINALCSITKLFPPDMYPYEISVDFVNEINFGWSRQVKFWKDALFEVKYLMENKWVISNQLLAQYFSSIRADDETGEILPGVNNHRCETYIRQLQLEVTKNDLVITSPYSTFSTQGMDSYIDDFELDEEITSIIPNVQNPKLKEAIPVMSSKKANRQLMECFLRLTTSTDLITASSFYDFPNVQVLVDVISSLRFQEQELSSPHLKDYEEVRRAEFSRLMKNFLKLNLVSLKDDGAVIDLSVLRRLYMYAKRRLQLLIKLRCHTSIIDIPHVLKSLQLYKRGISVRTVIDVFKITLQLLVSGSTGNSGEPLRKIIRNWWFEIKSSTQYCIHFNYFSR